MSLLTGEFYAPKRALELGLVDEVIKGPRESFLAEIKRRASTLTGVALPAYAVMKRTLRKQAVDQIQALGNPAALPPGYLDLCFSSATLQTIEKRVQSLRRAKL